MESVATRRQKCTPVSGTRVCENCGFEDDELILVRRVYVVPETWDQPASETVVPEPELWCVSCVSQYPCNGVEDEE
jgi:hypothetical protein